MKSPDPKPEPPTAPLPAALPPNAPAPVVPAPVVPVPAALPPNAPVAVVPVPPAPAPATRVASVGDPVLPEQSREDTDVAWGEYPQSADDRLYRDRPPHWDDH